MLGRPEHDVLQSHSSRVRQDEWLLSLARLLDRTGENGGRFVGILGVATYTLGSDAFGIAAMMLLYDAAMVIGYIIAGPATDFFGPRRTGILSLLLIGLISFGYQLVPDTIGFLGLMAVLTGIFMGIQSTAFNAYPPYLVPDEELQSFNGMMGAAANIGSILGPLVGGFFVLFFPPRAVFVPYGLMSLASMALLFFLPERITPTEQAAARGKASVGSDLELEHPHGLKATLSYAKDGLLISMRDPALFICLIMGWFGFFAFGAFDSLESLFYRDVLTVSAEWLGWLSAAAGGGTVIGAILMLRFPNKWLSLRGLAVMLLTVGVGTVIYVGTNNVWIACAGQIILGTGFGAFEPTQALMVQRLTDLAVVGRVLSIMRIGFRFAAVVPLLVAPFLAEAFGVQPVLVTAGIIVTIFGLGFVFGIPKRVNAKTQTEKENPTAADFDWQLEQALYEGEVGEVIEPRFAEPMESLLTEEPRGAKKPNGEPVGVSTASSDLAAERGAFEQDAQAQAKVAEPSAPGLIANAPLIEREVANQRSNGGKDSPELVVKSSVSG